MLRPAYHSILNAMLDLADRLLPPPDGTAIAEFLLPAFGDVVMEDSLEYPFPLNLIPLRHAVLCANCDVITESRNGHCVACGSPSLISLSRVLGRNRGGKRDAIRLENAKNIPRVA